MLQGALRQGKEWREGGGTAFSAGTDPIGTEIAQGHAGSIITADFTRVTLPPGGHSMVTGTSVVVMTEGTPGI